MTTIKKENMTTQTKNVTKIKGGITKQKKEMREQQQLIEKLKENNKKQRLFITKQKEKLFITTQKEKENIRKENQEEQRKFFEKAQSSFQSLFFPITSVQTAAIYKMRNDNQTKGFKADTSVNSIVENFQNSGVISLRDTIQTMRVQNMSFTSRKAVLTGLKIPENVVNLRTETGVWPNFLESVFSIQPVGSTENEEKLNHYMKDNEKTLALENKNNMDLSNTIPKVKNFNENSSREMVFTTARIGDLTKQGEIYNTNQPGTSQTIALQSLGGETMHYTGPVGWFDVSFFLIFFFSLSWVSVQLSKRLGANTN